MAAGWKETGSAGTMRLLRRSGEEFFGGRVSRGFADEYWVESSRLLSRHTKDLAALVAAVLRGSHWADLSVKTQRHLSEAAGDACDAAVADAAEFVNERLLSAAHRRVVDLRLKPDLRAMQAQIRSLFDSGKAPARGFVYVAWSARPECFMYVGKAKQVDRLMQSTIARSKVADKYH